MIMLGLIQVHDVLKDGSYNVTISTSLELSMCQVSSIPQVDSHYPFFFVKKAKALFGCVCVCD